MVLHHNDTCSIIGKSQNGELLCVSPVADTTTTGWIPYWLLTSHPTSASVGSNLQRFKVWRPPGAQKCVVSTTDGLTSKDMLLSQTEIDRLRNSDCWDTWFSYGIGGPVDIYLYNRRQYLFEVGKDSTCSFMLGKKTFRPRDGAVYVVEGNALVERAFIPDVRHLISRSDLPKIGKDVTSEGIIASATFVIKKCK